MSRVWTAVAGLAVAGAVLVGTTGCGEVGHRILYGNSTERPKSNLEYQRESALRFRTVWANVERIRYKEEGGKPGLGATWRANAVATVGGKDYEVIIGPNSLGFPFGDSPPKMSTLPPSTPSMVLEVTYSDGSSEVIE
ncbi:hypothetical protein [Leifsonia sp. 1010]|uniref:hypothetical protein n=1 Tax=Leifsonia sp. 1010 TaxID=2817769 RepID=UPI00285E1852|nr:hypothetical protein [Leifsonia sp. 1010]MDR6612754.1 hypothetical protein [Leifsonia sp. 1010]